MGSAATCWMFAGAVTKYARPLTGATLVLPVDVLTVALNCPINENRRLCAEGGGLPNWLQSSWVKKYTFANKAEANMTGKLETYNNLIGYRLRNPLYPA